MSRRCPVLVTTVAVLLGGCSMIPTPFGDDPDTIASLRHRTLEIDRKRSLPGGPERAAQAYREFLAVAPDGDLRPEAMRRLADLQLEAGESTEAPARADEAIALYQDLLERYPEHARADAVMYQLARAHEYQGEQQQALAVLAGLVQRCPASAYRAEAEFRRGEILFVQRRYGEADQAYRAVLALGDDGAFYDRALYKAGWARFKQARYEAALADFQGLLDRMLLAPDGAILAGPFTRAQQELLEDTLRVVGLSFSYLGAADTLTAWYRRHGHRAYEFLVYDRLGNLHLAKERFQDAAGVYAAFAETNPQHRLAPLFQMRVIEALDQGGFPTLVLEAKHAFVERYALTSDYWQAHDPAGSPDVVAYLKTNLQDLARQAHALAQKEKKSQHYAEAARWYRTFLDSFPADPESAGVNFLLAEVLFETGDFRQAAAEYERTAYDYQPHGRAAEAGYAALVAYERRAERLQDPERGAWQRRGIDSAIRFARRFPDHPKAALVAAHAAEDLFRRGEFELAAETATRVLELPSVTPELARTAWTVVAHASFDLGDYERAEAAYQQVLARMEPNHEKRNAISERLAASVYKQGEAWRDQGDLVRAVEDFLRVAAIASDSAIAATARFDAAAALMTLEDWPRAIEVLEAFRAGYPQHELQPEVTRRLAVAYMEAGRLGPAAAELERMAEQAGTDPELQRQALWQAGELYEKTGDSGRAAQAWQRYVQRFPQPLEPATEAYQRLAQLAAGRGDTRAQQRWLEALVAADRRGGPARTERTRYLAASASLALAEPAWQAYRQVRLTAPVARSLKRKKQAMEQALAALGAAADYGVAEVTTAATYRVAEIYRDMGLALMESERPKELSPEELEQYELLLEEQAYPFEEQAIGIHESNLRRAADGVYDEWVEKSRARLAELVPVRYAKVEHGEPFVQDIR